MTTREQKKQQKKLAREKEIRKALLAKREALAIPVREENALRKKAKRITKLKRQMGPLNKWSDETLINLSEQTLSQLEMNVKILKALEDEYQQEQEKKANLNKELEEEGYTTLEEKLNSLHHRIATQFEKSIIDVGVPADLSVEIPASEVSDVEVIKAEVSEVEVVKAVPEEQS